ncbi:MAG: hypothetical protein KGI75_22080 [Rhizobiaceae bacterium]|nr:hypothetical protein [Rhizobiaceae bacterium]
MGCELSALVSVTCESEIIVFPSMVGRANIERCARELDTLHGGDAVAYWKGECRKVADAFMATGMSEDDARRRVMRFQADVQAELVIRHEKRASAK